MRPSDPDRPWCRPRGRSRGHIITAANQVHPMAHPLISRWVMTDSFLHSPHGSPHVAANGPRTACCSASGRRTCPRRTCSTSNPSRRASCGSSRCSPCNNQLRCAAGSLQGREDPITRVIWQLPLPPMARSSRTNEASLHIVIRPAVVAARVEISPTTAPDRWTHGSARDRGRSERLPLATRR